MNAFSIELFAFCCTHDGVDDDYNDEADDENAEKFFYRTSKKDPLNLYFANK